MKTSDLLQSASPGSRFFDFCAVLSISLFLSFLPEVAQAQDCTVNGGIVATSSPTNNLCLNDGNNNPVQLTVSGNSGIGRFGLVQAGTGNVVASNDNGLFEMTNYPPGNYQAGHVSVQELATLSSVTNVNQLMGCYDLSNVIGISTYLVDGGTITALGPTEISGGVLEFEVSGASGPNQQWVLLNQTGTEILAVQPEGSFDFDSYPNGVFRVVHAAYGLGIPLNNIDPQNLPNCIEASNFVFVVKESIPELGPGEVYNPTTGRIWMDRNLGASQVATTPTNAPAYGDLYQWGRGADGHQIRTSPTTSTLSSSDQPGHGSFIITPLFSYSDWRSPQNDNLWQGIDGINNPCPASFRLPTNAEWHQERLSWSSNNKEGAFASPLKLTAGGVRGRFDGGLFTLHTHGNYWSSTVSGTSARALRFAGNAATMSEYSRGNGHSVRCIKD